MNKKEATPTSHTPAKHSGPDFVKHLLPQQDGVLVVHKPKGPTSAACIARIKHGLSQKKIGHAGTLDPMAEGVLLVLLGQATKLSGYLMDAGQKVYTGSIRLGITTDTWDAEGATLEERPVDGISEAAVHAAMTELVGTYQQQVPAYSAAKHQGSPLYELARKGLEVPVKSKEVTVFRGEVELVDLPHVRFRVTCSSGTYIRSLAHSLGNRLGCGAMLEELTREYSHPFGLAEAHSLDALLHEPEALASRVRSIADALPQWPILRATREEATRVHNGIPIAYDPETTASMPFIPGMQALLLDEAGAPLALVRSSLKEGQAVWSLLRGLWNPKP